MGLFDDFSEFLENRLEEFLRNNPHLELQALEEQLRKQEEDTLRLIAQLQRQEKKSEQDILSTAQEVKRWHNRVEKARTANRPDLAQAAQEREAFFLRQGNQHWGQMQGCKQRIQQAKELYRQIKQRREEVRAKAVQAEANRYTAKNERRWETDGWNQTNFYNFANSLDPLEEQFKSLETDEELEKMKRNMGK
ncbi:MULTISPECIES: TIGR04376 family protein [Okeania]|uniref:TIGR04376 family protein n=1 Tax=Okeania hirsuta TaxID=1458930 RepID=A0A3N6RNX1_9CYAN|nr:MULTISPECIES: TIGR04376 family protein [Okeania]NET15125.1 TIGR04376 family protein [Okeania sp. SIO1H6]NES74362.1 TIGR04376 family protein [Okeania sp. SIO1H4]NES91175.1 TIGR04376 family protein [Okeania sp. SIO2B9]NET18383.1 TIGR04376 family protein [Okeania sp. SIO1H5]NET75996.1 TIGR04376 family protein [Okeania sp. SIO1F9]